MRTGTNPKSMRWLQIALSIASLPSLMVGCATISTASKVHRSSKDPILKSPADESVDSRLSKPQLHSPLESMLVQETTLW
jgi:hypothetical protein